jgi:RNA polymerase sigma-70 factor, ECF subfamily
VAFSTENNLSRFTETYRKYHLLVRRVLFRIQGAGELDDLVQEVFLRVWKGLEKFREESQLKTWVYRIATNAGLDALKKKKIAAEAYADGLTAGSQSMKDSEM